MSTRHLDDAAWARLHDEARLRAELMRREAMNDFWRGTHAVFQRSLAAEQAMALRAANRLKARLARRADRRCDLGDESASAA